MISGCLLPHNLALSFTLTLLKSSVSNICVKSHLGFTVWRLKTEALHCDNMQLFTLVLVTMSLFNVQSSIRQFKLKVVFVSKLVLLVIFFEKFWVASASVRIAEVEESTEEPDEIKPLRIKWWLWEKKCLIWNLEVWQYSVLSVCSQNMHLTQFALLLRYHLMLSLYSCFTLCARPEFCFLKVPSWSIQCSTKSQTTNSSESRSSTHPVILVSVIFWYSFEMHPNWLTQRII